MTKTQRLKIQSAIDDAIKDGAAWQRFENDDGSVKFILTYPFGHDNSVKAANYLEPFKNGYFIPHWITYGS